MKVSRFTALFIFIVLNGAARSTNTPTDALTCVNDYKTTISCVWRSSRVFSDQGCVLTGISNSKSHKHRCELQTGSARPPFTWSCVLTLDESMDLSLTCNGSVVTKMNYKPGRHVRTRPPDQPTVNRDNITWSRGQNFPQLIIDCEYQLQFKDAHASWETARHRDVTHGTFVVLDHGLLTLGGQYQARVRMKPPEPKNEGCLKGQWSDWSPAVTWRSEVGETAIEPHKDTSPASELRVVLIIGFHILLVLALLSLIVCKVKKSTRLIKPKPQHVPDPSKYFQPLHTVHGGNFRRWLGCQNSGGPFLTPQSCDDISPVEVSDMWDVSLPFVAPLHHRVVDSGLENSGTSQASSSGFSNMGYFYSKSQTGSMHLESCPVYFSYHPDEGTGSTLSSPVTSCESLRIQTEAPMSPDSGFETVEVDGAERAAAEGNALVSFIMALSQGQSSAPGPVVMAWEDGCVSVSEPAEGAGVRPVSMIEPCGSGYLTLKEMQKYSNKSI